MSDEIVFDNLINSEEGQENYAQTISLKPASKNKSHNAKGLIRNRSAEEIKKRAYTFGQLVKNAASH